MRCEFTAQGSRMVCGVCGRSLPIVAGFLATDYHARCGPADDGSRHPISPSDGLGDWTERLLKSVGLTEERYKHAKEIFGLAPTCGCAARKEWLNKVSDWWRGQ
jgi:hypothetical protein